MENDIPCFSYRPYPEYLEMLIWAPSLKQFIMIGGCH
jgi:hypothetical protein